MHKIQRNKSLLFSFFLAMLGTLTFLEQDVSGLTTMHGLFSSQNIYRVSLFLTSALILLISRPKKNNSRHILKKNNLLFLLLTLFLLSIPVNSYPLIAETETLKSYYFLFEWYIFISTTAAINANGQLPEYNFIRLLKLTSIFYVTSIILFFIFANHLAIREDHRIGGFVIHPNRLAVIAVIGLLVFLLYSKGIYRIFLGSIFLVILLMTQSRSIILGSFAGIFIAYIMSSSSNKNIMSRLIIASALLLLSITFILTNLDQVISLLVRGQSIENLLELSSRTRVWDTSFQIISKNFFWGTGFNFGPKQSIAQYTQDMSWWNAPHAHNDIINTTLSSGIIAGLIIIIIYAQFLYFSFKISSKKLKFLTLAISLILLFHSMAEPIISLRVTSAGVMFIIVYVFVQLIRKNHGTKSSKS